MTGPRIITCDGCGKTFESAWTEADARAEAAKNFPKLDVDDVMTAVVCDDCYNEARSRYSN